MPLPAVKLARKTVPIYPDLQVSAEVEAATDAVDAARKEARAARAQVHTLASTKPAAAEKALKAAEKKLAEVTERAASTVLAVTIDQLPKKVWREFLTAHPAREGDDTDQAFNINWDSFVGAYLAQAPVTVAWRESGEPVEVAPSEWAEWVESIGDPEYQKLAMEILALNRQQVGRPF